MKLNDEAINEIVKIHSIDADIINDVLLQSSNVFDF